MITLTLNNQNLSISTPHIVGDTIDYLTVQIERSSEWQGMTLHVFFKKENTVYEIITDESFIDKNSHLNLSNGQWSVSVVGYRFVNDILVEKITTNSIGLKVATPPPKAGESMPSVPPSAFEQVEAMAKSVRDEARTGKFDGATFTPAVSDEGVLTWTNNKELPNPDPVNIKGEPGQDGDSPTASVQQTATGATISVTDKSGTTTANIDDGEDGYSPTISITDITGGHRVTITDKTGAHSFDVMDGEDGQDGVQDVQVAGTSVVSGGVANVPLASASTPGVVVSGTVAVTGTTPTINAQPGVRYVCGEVSTLDITLPESGIVDITFRSGSTPTVLTITPPTGLTVKWANGFDPTNLEANTTYEINIMDGCLGVAGTWS